MSIQITISKITIAVSNCFELKRETSQRAYFPFTVHAGFALQLWLIEMRILAIVEMEMHIIKKAPKHIRSHTHIWIGIV